MKLSLISATIILYTALTVAWICYAGVDTPELLTRALLD